MATQTRRHATRSTTTRKPSLVEGELLHIRDLERLRTILANHGATPAELRSYDAEIDQHRRELADVTGWSPLERTAA
jgi:hypothetical protein